MASKISEVHAEIFKGIENSVIIISLQVHRLSFFFVFTIKVNGVQCCFGTDYLSLYAQKQLNHSSKYRNKVIHLTMKRSLLASMIHEDFLNVLIIYFIFFKNSSLKSSLEN